MGCGSGSGEGSCANGGTNCISAQFTIEGGGSFLFDEPAQLAKISDDLRGLSAAQLEGRYSITLIVRTSKVTAPGQYSSGDALKMDPLYMWIGRPHATDPSKVTLSGASGEKVTFEKIDASSMRGTFTGAEVIRNTTDDKIHLTVSDGRFSGGE